MVKEKEEAKTQAFKSYLAQPPKEHVSVSITDKRAAAKAGVKPKPVKPTNVDVARTFALQAEYGRMKRIENIARSNKEVAWLLSEYQKLSKAKSK